MPLGVKILICILTCGLCGFAGYEVHKHKKEIKRLPKRIKTGIKLKVAKW